MLQAAEKVLEKALQTAVASWDLKETESATEAEATKQLKAAMQQALEDVKVELKKLGEEFKAVEKAGTDLIAHVSQGTDAASGSADESVSASAEVRNNPVRKADEQRKAAEARHDTLARGHEEEKGKHEEQTKKFVSQLKEQYAKVHELGQKMQGPLGETIQKSGVSIEKSAGVLMSQARGAIDQVAAAYAKARSAHDDAGKQPGGPHCGDPRARRRGLPAARRRIWPGDQGFRRGEEDRRRAREANRDRGRKGDGGGGEGGQARGGRARASEEANRAEQGALPRDADAQGRCGGDPGSVGRGTERHRRGRVGEEQRRRGEGQRQVRVQGAG